MTNQMIDLISYKKMFQSFVHTLKKAQYSYKTKYLLIYINIIINSSYPKFQIQLL